MTETDIPQDAHERRLWIRYRLGLAGYSLAKLGVELGRDRTTVQTALRRPYPAIESVIASKLGFAPNVIWPERYDAKGKPLRKKLGRPAKRVRHGGKHTEKRTSHKRNPATRSRSAQKVRPTNDEVRS